MEETPSLHAWRVLGVVTLTMSQAVGILKGFSVLIPDIKEQLDTSTWIVGSAIAAITLWGYLLGK